jgi:hypothetical protein
VTLVSGGRYVGVASLGTSLTDEQAGQLDRIGKKCSRYRWCSPPLLWRRCR